MRNLLLALIVASTAAVSVPGSASAQSFYFGFGNKPSWDYGPRYYRPYRAYRPHYYRGYAPAYRRYRSYDYGNCYYRTRRYFDDYRGVWVVRRIQVCD